MREIKFRAWDKVSKEWNITFYIDSNGLIYKNAWDVEDGSSTFDLELLQFTGLKDKNGKEIYEGDILRAEYLGTHIAPVEFIRGSFRLQTNGHIDEVRQHLPIDFPFPSIEIIGNIYENSELLKA